jgi:hypothetical protein
MVKKMIEEIKFRLKCLRAEVLYRVWDIAGVIREVQARLGGRR